MSILYKHVLLQNRNQFLLKTLRKSHNTKDDDKEKLNEF